MTIREVDVAILGAGTAGLAAYRAAAEHTDNLVMIDGGPLGTTCARVGCMPSKLLIAAAEAAHQSRYAAVFGVHNESTSIDGVAVMARIRSERDRFVGFVLESIDSIPERHKIDAYAHFIDEHLLELSNGERIRARSVVIATGSRPVNPPILDGAGTRLLSTDDVFELSDLPQKLAVFGPGVIGLELGQAFSRLGVEIKLFGVGGSIGPLRDPVVKDYAKATFESEFYLDLDAKVESVTELEAGVEILYRDKEGKAVKETFDYLLAATGRKANVDALALKSTNLPLGDRGLPEFNAFTLQCGKSGVFIAGDANNDKPLLHEAADEGKIAGHNAALFPQGVRAGLRRAPLAIVFSDPQIASVGLNLEQVKLRCGDRYGIGEVSFENQGRARVMAVNKGILRVYGEQGSGLFLGAEIFGPRAEHIAHLLAWTFQQRMHVSRILEMPFYHPVIEEGLRTALKDLNAQLNFGPQVDEKCMDCGPGG